MYQIEQVDYGYRLKFGDFIQPHEMKTWMNESIEALTNAPNDFGVFIDLREIKPLPTKSQSYLQQGQKYFKEKGMKRSVVILDKPITKMQFKRIAKETGIYDWERYIDATTDKDWEQKGIDWITSGIDPDQ